MNESITIVLPLPSKVLNPNWCIGSYDGRIMKNSAAKKYRRLAKEAVESENVESAPWEVVGVKAIFHFPTKRKRDQDNFMASLKSAYDGIVDSGLIGNDDYDHMKRESPEFLLDKTSPRVILEITRIA